MLRTPKVLGVLRFSLLPKSGTQVHDGTILSGSHYFPIIAPYFQLRTLNPPDMEKRFVGLGEEIRFTTEDLDKGEDVSLHKRTQNPVTKSLTLPVCSMVPITITLLGLSRQDPIRNPQM